MNSKEPMTFEQWYQEKIWGNESWEDGLREAWEACEQQNQAVIAELVEALESLVNSCEKSNQRCLDQIGMGLIDLIMIQKAKEAIAKVKGK